MEIYCAYCAERQLHLRNVEKWFWQLRQLYSLW